MSKLLKAKKVLLFSFFLVFVLSLPVAATNSEWKSQGYKFELAKNILVKKPVFIYERAGTNTGNQNYFEKYPNSENVIMSMLSKEISKLPKYRFMHETTAVAGTNSANASETTGSSFSDDPYSTDDLVLSIKIIDFGWYYEHYEGYWATETVTQHETIYEKDSSGKMQEKGKKEIKTSIPVYHPPGYKVKDFAVAEFTFSETKTGETVWTYRDARDRSSNKNSWESDGPESMMHRIFSAAFEKMPLIRR